MKNNHGFLSLELAIVMGIVAALMLSMVTAGSRVRSQVELTSFQTAMLYISLESPNQKFPSSVSLDKLSQYGALTEGYTIDSYDRSANGFSYSLAVISPAGILSCVTPSSISYNATCP